MASLTTPSSTSYFTCFAKHELPEVRLPRGFGCTKLSPEHFFRNWQRVSQETERVYLSNEFSTRVLRSFEPVVITDIPANQGVYCWRPVQGKSVTWADVYREFPQHAASLGTEKPQVSLWYRIQEVVFGWKGQSSLVPKNDRGALLMLGDAGVFKTDPSGAIIKGKQADLVQVSHYAMVGPATWVMNLPHNEHEGSQLPNDIVILTIQ